MCYACSMPTFAPSTYLRSTVIARLSGLSTSNSGTDEQQLEIALAVEQIQQVRMPVSSEYKRE